MYEEIIQRWKDANPLNCHELGFHEYDGIIPDLSPEGIAKRVGELKADIMELEKLKEPSGNMEKYEYNLLLTTLRIELYYLDVRKEYLKSPAGYMGWGDPIGVIESSYTKRNFDTVENRIKSIIKMESGIDKYLAQMREYLKDVTISRPKIMLALDVSGGYVSYLSDELVSFVSQTKNDDLLQEWSEVNESAVAALKETQAFLQQKLETAIDEFALGEEDFLELLNKTEGVNVSLEKLLEVAEKDLERNYNQIINYANELKGGNVEELLKDILLDTPDPNNMLEYATETLGRTRQFLIDKDLVTIPSMKQCEVVFSPQSVRSFIFAAMNTPGPFDVDEASQAYYWVTPPDKAWDEEKTTDFMKMFNKSEFESITVHEVWPGHYLQLLYSNNTESVIAKMFADSYSMVEGWAHYAEEMIYDEGYAPFDRYKFHIGQLLEALIRNVRFVCAIKMHCKGMTVEEAKQLFIEKSFQSEVISYGEAMRGTIDPMYLNYTLGKLMILKLREDYKKEQGGSYSLKKFHDTLLSYGSPPITVLRTMMLKNPDGDIL